MVYFIPIPRRGARRAGWFNAFGGSIPSKELQHYLIKPDCRGPDVKSGEAKKQDRINLSYSSPAFLNIMNSFFGTQTNELMANELLNQLVVHHFNKSAQFSFHGSSIYNKIEEAVLENEL